MGGSRDLQSEELLGLQEEVEGLKEWTPVLLGLLLGLNLLADLQAPLELPPEDEQAGAGDIVAGVEVGEAGGDDGHQVQPLLGVVQGVPAQHAVLVREELTEGHWSGPFPEGVNHEEPNQQLGS